MCVRVRKDACIRDMTVTRSRAKEKGRAFESFNGREAMKSRRTLLDDCLLFEVSNAAVNRYFNKIPDHRVPEAIGAASDSFFCSLPSPS